MALLSEDRLADVCQREFHLAIICIGCTVGLVVTVLSLLVVDRDSGAFVVAVLNLPGLFGFAVGTGYLLYRCRQAANDPGSPVT